MEPGLLSDPETVIANERSKLEPHPLNAETNMVPEAEEGVMTLNVSEVAPPPDHPKPVGTFQAYALAPGTGLIL